MDLGAGRAAVAVGDADRRSALPATLAAVAEAGVLYLPAQYLVSELARADRGPLVTYVVFVPLFALAVALATGLRRFRATPSVVAVGALALGSLQGARWGSGEAGATLGVVILALALGFRAIVLAHRDWRDPIAMSFGVGAVAVLFEIVLAPAVGGRWANAMPLVVPQFFLFSLASRAASLRLEQTTVVSTDAGEAGAEANRGPWSRAFRWALAVVGALGLVEVVSVLAGGHGGLLQALGRFVFPVVEAVVTAIVWVIAQLMRPVFWLAQRIHLDVLGGLQRALERIQHGNGTASPTQVPTPGPAARLIGLLILAGFAVALFLALRRHRRRLLEFSRQDPEVAEMTPLPGTAPRRRRLPLRFRREMPADTVRRLYAEVLLTLEERGLAKATALTPGEYLGEVADAFPSTRGPFEALTRAYELVRYGHRQVDGATAADLRRRQESLLGTFRKAPRADQDEPDDDPETG